MNPKKYEKIKYDEILNAEENMKKIKIRKILRQKENMKTTNMRKILNQKENMRKTNMRKILNQKFLSKVEKFCQQIRQDPYFICTLCHRCLYKRTDYLNMKSIIFLLQNSIARWDDLMKNLIYMTHVINTFPETKCHVKQSSIKWV